MDTTTHLLFFKAVLIGFSIAAPVGPIGLLTIQRTLERGMTAGFATGMGAALADMLYGAIGAFGVRWVIDALSSARIYLAIGGGALLLWLAWQTWRTPIATTVAKAPGGPSWASCFIGTFFLTLSNPATILSFVAVFGALSGNVTGSISPLPMVLGVLFGSSLWWLTLSTIVGYGRRHFTDIWRQRINTISAMALAAFALWQWASIF